MPFCTIGGLEDILGDGKAQLGEVNDKDRKGTIDNEALAHTGCETINGGIADIDRNSR
jgi:hypothetical protein